MDNIKAPENLSEIIRLRPAMYVGNHHDRGLLILFKSIMIHFLQNYEVKKVKIDFLDRFSGRFEFYSLEKQIEGNLATKEDFTTSYKGFELIALKALSKYFTIKFLDKDNNILLEQIFEDGVLKEGKDNEKYYKADKVEIYFKLDLSAFWHKLQWNIDAYLDNIREFAFLYNSKIFEINYKILENHCKVVFHYPNGLKDRLELEKVKNISESYFNTHFIAEIDNFYIECAFAFTAYEVDETFLITYVNDEKTWENGTHLEALLQGLTFGVMKYFQKYELTGKYKISEKGIKESLIAFLNIRLEDAKYSGCVKNKLANPEIIKPISDYITELFFQKIENDKETTKELIRKFEVF